ncbi:MAG: hypothetical protein LBR64_00210 [Dysgonamonadaceae bacterium]|jgi:hypothetical protein|nr:hypothetical protein [Dysgonamonadaceae bacterium]
MRLNLLIIVLLIPLCGIAQTLPKEGLFSDNYRLETGSFPRLAASIDNISFFDNMEADGKTFKGYTLPGFRIEPRLIYRPAEIVKLEAGLSALRYWGIDKYPNFAYRNIAEWKAEGYQIGFHLLPFFRAQIQPTENLNIVLGNIYGGGNHRLAEFMYAPELNLTADPEQGFQILLDTRPAHLDVWVNWETFIFNNQPHDEVFSFGTSAEINLNRPESRFHASIPVQFLGTHHGGEIDTVHGTVETVVNAASGLHLAFNSVCKQLKTIELDLLYARFLSDADEGKYPFKSGSGFYARMNAEVRNLSLFLSYWQSRGYINNFGLPVFGNLSTAYENAYFPESRTFNLGFRYGQSFGAGCYLGFSAETFYRPRLKMIEQEAVTSVSNALSWYSAISLRINPSIVLSK